MIKMRVAGKRGQQTQGTEEGREERKEGGREGGREGRKEELHTNIPDIPQPHHSVITPRRNPPPPPSLPPSLPGNARDTRCMRSTITPHGPLDPYPHIPPFQTGIIPPTPNDLPPSLPPSLVLVCKDSDPDFDRLGREGVGLPGGEKGEFAGVGMEGVDGEAAFALAGNDTLQVMECLLWW
jgi:hypothetical protein